jgi:uncharacterized DUF497 family protein
LQVATAGVAGFDWDDGNRSKCQKHGLTIAEIEHILAHGETVIVPVVGLEESRFIGIGLTTKRRFAFVVFTTRETGNDLMLRPISARYMHQREVRKYGEAIANLQKRRGS